MNYENYLSKFLTNVIRKNQQHRTIQQISGTLTHLDDNLLQYLRNYGGLERFICTHSNRFKVDRYGVVTLNSPGRGRNTGYIMHTFKNYGYITDSPEKVDRGVVNDSDVIFYSSDIQNISSCTHIVPYDEVQFDLQADVQPTAVNIILIKPFAGISQRNEGN